jgi:tRNA threonylcarbamoyladenosine biosynthesis protein TsaE
MRYEKIDMTNDEIAENGAKKIEIKKNGARREEDGFEISGKFPAVSSVSPEITGRIGEILSKYVFPGLLILLSGDLGAGKTLLAGALGSSLGAGRMRSPTFTIESVHKLPGKNFSLVHCDLYRLEAAGGRAPRALSDAVMQIEERLLDGDAALVEWGDRWPSPPVADRWDVFIYYEGGYLRELEFAAYGQRALESLSDAYLELLELTAPGMEDSGK